MDPELPGIGPPLKCTKFQRDYYCKKKNLKLKFNKAFLRIAKTVNPLGMRNNGLSLESKINVTKP
jgi:hypothetical protein